MSTQTAPQLKSTRATPASTPRLREGSPWTGLGAVIAREMASHLTSARMQILEVLIVLTAFGTVFAAMQNLKESVGQDQFIYLKLFTTSRDPLPAFIGFLAFLVPLIAIALAFDAVNGEFSRRTLSRVLAQPIYRDALLLGKFLGGFFTLILVITAIWLLIFGLGIIGLGVPPGGQEVARGLWFLVVTVLYGGIWLALALVFSVVFRQSATAALASIAVWLFFTVFWGILVGLLVQAVSPVRYGFLEEFLRQTEVRLMLTRLSPNTLFAEATMAILQPSVRSLGLILPTQLDGAIYGAPLPLGQSVLLIWPHLTGLIAGSILLFALAYVLFQRQEIRA